MAGLLAHWTDLSGGGLAAEGWQPVIRLALVATAYVALNNLLVVGVMSIAGAEPLLVVLRETVRFTAAAEIALAVLGGLAAFMWLTSPTWLPVIMIAALLGQVALSYIGTSVRKTAEMLALAERNNDLYHDARAALKMRDEFLIVAAHELRTPITTLRGYAQLLARQMRDGALVEPQQLRRSLLTFESQADRLGRLTETMLDISRIDAGLVTIARRPTDLKRLAVEVAARAQARSTDHMVSVEGPPTLMALVDEVRLHQVVAELIDNAIAHGPTLGAIQLTLSSAPGAVTVSVLDQGVALDLEQHALIFERFYQVQAVEHHTSGMGLGLYRSRRIAELHGGRIEVSRPPTGGTCFSVVLPGAALPAAAAA
jgi:signal transduction histidine kinase